SDRIIVMDKGRIAQHGTPRELYEAPASRFLADFIGDANLVDGELSRDDGGMRFTAHGVSMIVPADGLAPGAATLAIRPHALAIVAPNAGVLTGRLTRAAYLGGRMEYVVDTAWGELLVFDADVRRPRARDDEVALGFSPEAAVVLPR